MKNTPAVREKRKAFLASINRAFEIIDTLPEDVYIDMWMSDTIHIQGHTQEEVRSIRRLFPIATWKKEYNPSGTWTYLGELDGGVKVEIYACREAPPSCRLVEKTVIEKRWEPETPMPDVKYVQREVPVTKKVWQCGPELVDAA